jgi:hypothetical protein
VKSSLYLTEKLARWSNASGVLKKRVFSKENHIFESHMYQVTRCGKEEE